MSDKVLNLQDYVLTPPVLHHQPRMAGKNQLRVGTGNGILLYYEQGKAREVKYCHPPCQGPGEDNGKNWGLLNLLVTQSLVAVVLTSI